MGQGMTVKEATNQLKRCELINTCYDGKHGHCGGCNNRIARDMAIKSLEAWEKVREEIKNYDNFIICANGQKGIHIDKVLEIIDKHLSEVSE